MRESQTRFVGPGGHISLPQVLVDESDCQLPAIEGEVAVEKTAKKRIMASLRRFLGKAPKERVASSSQIRSSVSSIAPVEKGFGSVTTRPPSYRLLGHDQKAAPFHSNSSPLTSKQHPRESMLLPAWESPDSISAPLPVIDPQATPNSGTSPPSLSPLASSRGRLPAPGQELQPCSSASSTPNGQYLRSRTTDLPSSSMSPRCNTNTSSHANASANATSIDPVGGVARAINAASRLLRGAPNSQLMPSQRTPSALSASTAAQPMRRFATADLESNTNAFAAPTSPYERFPSGLPYSPLGAWGEEAAAEEERPARERRPPPLQLPPVQVTPPHIMPVAGQMAAADATVGRSHGGRSGSSGNSPWERLPLQLVTACAPPAMQHAVGTCAWGLEDFHVYGMLYEGPSSAVYKATCLRSGLKVVLKVYNLERLPRNLIHRLVREVRIHSDLQHKNVVQMYGVFQEEGSLFLVQERADRGDLYHIHRGQLGSRMSEPQLAGVVLAPLLDALAYLHAKGVCHRDIKPENILLSADWTLRLADFGAAINISEERAVTRTGTADYMAPEVERCPLKALPEENKENASLAYTTAADIWSVGVLAFEMLCGFPPFASPDPYTESAEYSDLMYTEDELLQQAIQAQQSNSSEGRSSARASTRRLSFPHFVSPGAREFISSALAMRPGDRPTAMRLRKHTWLVTAATAYGDKARRHAARKQLNRLQQQMQQVHLQQQWAEAAEAGPSAAGL